MRRMVAGFALSLAGFALRAADSLQPLAVKAGQWAITRTTENSGMPPIPAETLARLSPEQRARMEAAMKARQGAHTVVSQSCVTPDQLKKSFDIGIEQRNCTRQIVTSTSAKQEVHFECTGTSGMKQSGSIVVEAVAADRIKGAVHMTASGAGNTMSVDSNFTGKWLGAACTEKGK